MPGKLVNMAAELQPGQRVSCDQLGTFFENQPTGLNIRVTARMMSAASQT